MCQEIVAALRVIDSPCSVCTRQQEEAFCVLVRFSPGRRSLTLLPGCREGSARAWTDSWRTPLLSLSCEGKQRAFLTIWFSIRIFQGCWAILLGILISTKKRGSVMLDSLFTVVSWLHPGGDKKNKKVNTDTDTLTSTRFFPRSRYLSRTNSAISFCICFPFSCLCSKTSKPVRHPLLWLSLLSVCQINTRKNTVSKRDNNAMHGSTHNKYINKNVITRIMSWTEEKNENKFKKKQNKWCVQV